MDYTLPPAFNDMFSGWTRIEPRCRADDFARALAACVADPLWIVGRQWQLAELKAEDAGSPIEARLNYSTRSIARLETGAQNTTLGAAPLETLIEREAARMDWRARIRLGQQLERFLREELEAEAASDVICRFRMRFPVRLPEGDDAADMDEATYRFVELMAGRAVNGEALLAALDRTTSPPAVPAGLGLTGDVVDATCRALGRLLAWDDAFASRPPAGQATAWVPRQLEYAFKLSEHADGGGMRLDAPHYRCGELDWHTLDRGAAGPDMSVIRPLRATLVPARVSFYGMPDARWWAFEDGSTDFGRLDVAHTDIAKLMLMEFALVYGNDWHIVPLRLPTGSINTLAPLVIVDVFGQQTKVGPVSAGGASPLESWQMFGLAPSPTDAEQALVIPPVVERLESDALEEGRFILDEGANKAFAIEARILNGLGESADGYESQRDRRKRNKEMADRQDIAAMNELIEEMRALLAETATAADAGSVTPEVLAERVAALRAQIDAINERLAAGKAETEAVAPPYGNLPSYRLATKVPDNWIPYLPVRQDLSYRSIAFRQGCMLWNEDNDAPEPIRPMSRLLATGGAADASWLNEECIPREGRRLTLTWRRARWSDGTTHLWLGRSVSIGKGAGSSGLRFDEMEDSNAL